MAFSSLGGSSSLDSMMSKSNQNVYGDGQAQIGDLESFTKFLPFDMDEPTSVLELSQCISPPLPADAWASQKQRQQEEVRRNEQQVQQQFLQQQQILQQQQFFQQIFQQQQQQEREQQQWVQQQAEIADLQYLQNVDRQNNYATGFEIPYTPESHHLLQSTWDAVSYDSYQNNGGDDPMIMQTLQTDPWVDFQQQENIFGSQLMQGLPCLEDPLILESWITSYSGDSSLSSVCTEVESSSSQSFLMPDEHDSVSNSANQQQQQQQQQNQQQNQHQKQQRQQQQQQEQMNLMSRCSSAGSAAAPEGSDFLDNPIENQQCEMQLTVENFNSNSSGMFVDSQSSMEDIKPSLNWFVPAIQHTIGPPVQQLLPSPLMTSSTYAHLNQPSISRTSSPIPQFQMTIPASDSITNLNHHRMTNNNNFINAQPVASASEIKPSPRMFETPIPVTPRPQSMGTPVAVEASSKPSTKLWGPVRPTSHSLGPGDSVYSSRSVSESPLSRRRTDATGNQKSGGDHHGQKNCSNDHNSSGRVHSTGGAGRVVTLAELASGGVKMGGVQLPTVGTQIPSVVRLAVETQASGMGGVRMVQVLLACAEAVACRDSRQANILLQQLQHMACPYGDAMQRITACFVEGLSARLAITGSQPFKFTNPIRKPPSNAEKREGFNLVYQSSPYVAFGHFAANSAILEAFEGEERMHIVDLGMTHSLQWPYLIHGLAKRPSGPPKLLRITGFGLSVESMKEAGQELSRVAAEAKVPFEFHAVEGPLEDLKRSKLELREGEALAVNSVLQLHCVVKESRGSLNAVLQSIHELSPKILTLVEQDASHNGPFFLGRFMEALHYYSAIFDSLDAILPRNSEQRVKMEQFHFAEEIKNIVSCEGPARVERHERVDQWRRRMSRAGFQPLPLKFLSQARLWLGLYSCDGYTLSEEKGCLVLGWKGKPIIAASSWKR